MIRILLVILFCLPAAEREKTTKRFLLYEFSCCIKLLFKAQRSWAKLRGPWGSIWFLWSTTKGVDDQIQSFQTVVPDFAMYTHMMYKNHCWTKYAVHEVISFNAMVWYGLFFTAFHAALSLRIGPGSCGHCRNVSRTGFGHATCDLLQAKRVQHELCRHMSHVAMKE